MKTFDEITFADIEKEIEELEEIEYRMLWREQELTEVDENERELRTRAAARWA